MNNQRIKVSIIVPIYNVEKYLPQCLDSIIGQTYQNLEIILVNDGTLDNAGKIADEYAKKDDRIIVVCKENEGVSVARNVGIDIATGDYICFSDADDYLMPEYVEYLLGLAIKNDADVSITKEMFTTFHTHQIDKDKEEVYSPEEATVDILSYNVPIGVYCKMFKRSFLGKEIRFIPHIFIGEGFNFNTMAFQRANKVAVGTRRVYFYRRNNPVSATTRFSLDKWENAIYAIENIHNDLIIRSDKIERAWKYANWHTHCDAFNFMVMAKADKVYPEIYKKYKTVVKREVAYSFRIKIRLREKIRAVICMIFPRMIPWLMNVRNRKFADKEIV